MANLDITYSRLTDVARDLTMGQQNLQEILTDLMAKVTDLTADGFRTDTASGQYETSYTEFHDGIMKAVAGLEGMSTFLTSTATAYADVDSQLAAGISGA